MRHFARAVEAARESSDRVSLARALIGVGQIERDLYNFEAARVSYEEAATIVRSLNDPLWLAHTVRHVADNLREEKNFDLATAHYEEALAIYRATAETAPLDLANLLRGYALLKEQLGDIAMAKAFWQEARAIYASADLQPGVDESTRRLAILG
jgi:tetratricopeptide (TPR) repeat protein